MTTSVAALMTVLGEDPERLGRRLSELAAQEQRVDEVVVAAPAAEHPTIEAAIPIGAPFMLRLVDNPTGGRSAGLNLAAAATRAELAIRVDARSSLSPQHVGTCVAVLKERTEVGVVGGPQRPVAAGDGVLGRGIARALANPWALGGAAYRRSASSRAVDTVYLGAFRREQLLGIGGYDERLSANEDFELCQRFRRHGLLVWLDPRAGVDYEPRSTLPAVASQYFAFGRSKVRFWRLTGSAAQPRQVMALGGVGSGIAILVWALRRPARLISVLAAGAGAVALTDLVGAPRQPRPRPAERLAALATYPVVWSSWVLGVADETLRSRR